MKRFPAWVLLLAAGCGISDPREDAVLFDSAEERAKRDLFAFYYCETLNGGVFSIVVPRSGPAESVAEIRAEVVEAMRGAGTGVRRRMRGGGPVDDKHREAIEGFFAGLPPGLSERTLATDVTPKPSGGFEPEVERLPQPPARVRILHVSGTGEVKILTLHKAESKSLPAGVEAGGATTWTIDELFRWLGGPKDPESGTPGMSSRLRK